jgi:hypothetical protein
MESRTSPQLDRLDRHVRRTYLRVADEKSRYRATRCLEEALRLANFPDEEEGRIYCFRRVSLSGIPAQSNRKIWTDSVQKVLDSLAAQAVHGTDPRACVANTIFFHNNQEALETLLRRALESEAPWFSASILGLPPESRRPTLFPAILEHLRQPPISPAAAAAILFAGIGTADPTPLLAAIPSVTIRSWLRELDGQKHTFDDGPPVSLPLQFRTVLQQVVHRFGWQAPQTVWLAAQAIICLSPATLASGIVLNRARSTLAHLELTESLQTTARKDSVTPDNDRTPASNTRLLFFNDENDSTRLFSLHDGPGPPQSIQIAAPSVPGEQMLPAGSSFIDGRTLSPNCLLPAPAEEFPNAPHETPPLHREPVPSEGLPFKDRRVQPTDHVSAPSFLSTPKASSVAEPLESILLRPSLLGEPTLGAGLYFLLHVLRRLGICVALESCPALAQAGLVDHILKRLAIHAGVVQKDPILLCLDPTQKEFSLSQEDLAALPLHSNIWPANIRPLHRASFESLYLLRIWALAVRRWCWRVSRITVREIANRSGRVWLTRTDLDVTLPLAATDIRIRRAGLDIDPGWLPWFGQFGRVVRFHYRDREPERSAC